MELSKLVEMKKNEWIMRTLLLVSASSYTIYLFHTTFMGFAKALCVRLSFNSDIWYVFVSEAIVVTFAGVAIPMMLHYWVLKRYALTRTLFGL